MFCFRRRRLLRTKLAISRFRWVALQLDEVAKCRTMGTLRTVLSSLPRTLDETYARTLGKIEEADKPQVFHILEFCLNLWDLEPPARRQLFKYWANLATQRIQTTLMNLSGQYNKYCTERNSLEDALKIEVLGNSCVIGMTTTG